MINLLWRNESNSNQSELFSQISLLRGDEHSVEREVLTLVPLVVLISLGRKVQV